MKTDLLTKQYDEQFAQIKNLRWYPLVGKNYPIAKQKVLIIGASQYATTENGEYDEETAKAFNSDVNTSRKYALNTVYKEEEPAKFYTNLLKLFSAENKTEQTADFWSNVSFYHFFQNVDKQVSNNSYKKKERLDSWDTWFEVVKVIRPDVCIFLGIQMYYYFDVWSKNNGLDFEWQDLDSGFYKRGQQPIYGKTSKDNDFSTSFWFLRHPSSPGFSSSKWNEFMKQKMPETIHLISQK